MVQLCTIFINFVPWFNFGHITLYSNSMLEKEKLAEQAAQAAQLNAAGQAQEMPQLDWSKLLIENVADEAEPPALFNIYGVEVIPENAVSIIAAQKKSGKTNFAGLLMAASICPAGNVLGGAVRSNLGKLNILFADTEQPLKDARRTLRRMMKTAGYEYNEQWRAHQITAISVKDLGEAERQDAIEQAIQAVKPQLVFIDGIADLLPSVNDEQAAKDVMNWMDAVSNQYKCAVVGMLHLNFGSAKIGGWAGTMAAKKYTDYFALKKSARASGGYFTVEHEGRGESAPDLRFKISCPPGDKIGHWENVDATEGEEMTKEDAENQALTELLQAAPLPCRNVQLIAWIMQTKHDPSKSKADKLLAKAKKLGILNSKKIGNQSVWFRPSEGEPQSENDTF